jgi:hypothetical protein
LPLLDVKVDIAGGNKKNEPLVIALPQEYANKTMVLLVDDGLLYAKTNSQANIVINTKELITLIRRKGFVLVDN